MSKFLIITINLLFLSLFGSIDDNAGYIEILAPETGTKKVAFPVTITIHNDDQDGFSKFHQVFPEGSTVEVEPIDDATITYTNNELKIIWIEKPEISPVIINYTLKISDPASTRYTFSGEYIYVSQGQRKTLTLPKHNVSFGGDADLENSDLKTVRSLTKISDDIYHMKISIDRGDISGFVRLSDQLPEGAIVESLHSNGASFSTDNSELKYIWMSIPQENIVDVSYKLNLTNAVNKDPNFIKGQISYLNKGAASTIYISEISENDEVYTEEELVKEIAGQEPEKEVLEEIAVVEEAAAPMDDIVTFSVQIMAAKKVVDDVYFKKAFNYSGDYHIENHKGWIKYSVGSYGQYVQARNKRNEITNQFDFPGPFVIAHRQDERISTQEALMITNQKWIK